MHLHGWCFEKISDIHYMCLSAIVTFWELDNIIGINNNLRIAFDTIIEQEIPQKWKGPRLNRRSRMHACRLGNSNISNIQRIHVRVIFWGKKFVG